MMSRRVLLCMAGWAILAPVPLAVLFALARLLAALGDAGGAQVINGVALAVGIVWVVGLILLLVALAAYVLFPPDEPGE